MGMEESSEQEGGRENEKWKQKERKETKGKQHAGMQKPEILKLKVSDNTVRSFIFKTWKNFQEM